MQETKRVEDIVDKLYDEDIKKGKSVVYRRRPFNAENTSQRHVPPARRYNFAPALLLGPDKDAQTDDGSGQNEDDGRYGFEPWPKKWKNGIVPYFIDTKYYDTNLCDVIMNAFDNFEKATCIRLQRLRERPVDSKSLQSVEWLYITNPSGIQQCVHSNEKLENKGVQMVIFGYRCMKEGEMLHEIMHVLGFPHEHTRPDRDEHITVLWDNIKPGYKKFFEARREDPLMNLPYDHSSVMHYPPKAFSKNGQLTLRTEVGVNIGQRNGLSATDIEKIGIVFGYECVNRDRQYLMQTCPTVAKTKYESKTEVPDSEIDSYFESRLWPYGVVNYQIRYPVEFSIEELENIKTVLRHIETETCLQFRDINQDYDADKEQITVNDEENKKKLEKPVEKTKTNLVLDPADVRLKALDTIKNEIFKHIKAKNGTFKSPEFKTFVKEKKKKFNIKMKLSFSKGLDDSFKVFVDNETDNVTFILDKPTSDIKVIFAALDMILRIFVQRWMPIFFPKIFEGVPDDLKSFNLTEEEWVNKIKYFMHHQLAKTNNESNNFQDVTEIEKPMPAKDLQFKILTEKETGDISPKSKKQKLFLGLEALGIGSVGNLVNGILTVAETVIGDPVKVIRTAINVTGELPKIIGEGINGMIENVVAESIGHFIGQKLEEDNKNTRRDFETSKISPARRHANNILTLARSSNPGCLCPAPGRTNGDQVIEINGDCFNSVNILLHLFVHLLGLDHQHNMHDRDDYLNILWDKISPEISAEMRTKLPPAASAGFSYDYQSVMHYPWLEIKDGVTMIMYPVWDDGWDIGHWQGLSITDISKINKIYANQCEERKKQATETFA